MKRAACLVVLAVALLGWGQSREEGEALYRDRKFAEAAASLERYLRGEPADQQAHLLLGLAYQLSERREKAEAQFRKAVQRWPQNPRARYFLARILFLRGKGGEALEEAAQARAFGEAGHVVANLEGLILTESGESEEALAAFDRAAVKAPPDFGEPHLNAGKLLLRLGRAQEAQERLARAIELQPGHPEAFYQRARARLDLGRRQEAIADLEAALSAGAPAEAQQLLARIRRSPVVRQNEPSAGGSVPIVFEDVTGASGVDFVLENSPTPEKHLPEAMPGGIAVFDYDGDGLLDLYFPNGALTPSLRKEPKHRNRLYRNLGGFRFEDVTAKAGVSGSGYAIGAAVADYDGDGDIDLLVAGVDRVELFRNRGDGIFEEVARQSGLSEDKWSITGAWLDADGDGWLDLFLVRYLDWSPTFNEYCGDERSKLRVYCHPSKFQALSNKLYRNNGDGTFRDITEESGIGFHKGKGMSVAASDFDGDGDTDLFVPNDTLPNFLLVNDGKGKFLERGLEAGVALTENAKPLSGMGASAGDYNGDGQIDVIMTALPGETFPLFHNLGDGFFREMTYATGLGALTASLGGWGVALADFNNDGWLDIATANSHVTDNIEKFSHERYRQPVRVFAGLGGRFRDDSAASGPALEPRRPHRGLVAADLDGDQKLDLVITALGKPARLLRNVTSGGNAIVVELVGKAPNTGAVGAKVRVGSKVLEMNSTAGYASSVLAPVQAGVGSADSVEMEVTWPNGDKRQIPAVLPGDLLRVKQADD